MRLVCSLSTRKNTEHKDSPMPKGQQTAAKTNKPKLSTAEKKKKKEEKKAKKK
jgi:hypothetical protein